MNNEWLDDFRNDLYTLGRAIWDYQEGVPGAIFDVCNELDRVGRGVIKEWKGLFLSSETVGTLVSSCVSHLVLRNIIEINGELLEIDGTSLIDRVDLVHEDAYSYAVGHMTEYLRNRHKTKVKK
jgi:hypothetical protein